VVFQLYSHRHYYNADADAGDALSASRASSPSPSPVRPPPPVIAASRPHTRRVVSTRFGSAAALGSSQSYPPRGRTPSVPPRVAEKHEVVASGVHASGNGVRSRDFGARRDVEAAPEGDEASEDGEEEPEINLGVAVGALVAATGLTYLTAEALTDALQAIGASGAVSPEWLGLVLLAVVGNAAEHVTAVFVAYRNKVRACERVL
jgi:Ca2+:H+ antiporter